VSLSYIAYTIQIFTAVMQHNEVSKLKHNHRLTQLKEN